jgi:subtilisin-like proprotein convertase family protein
MKSTRGRVATMKKRSKGSLYKVATAVTVACMLTASTAVAQTDLGLDDCDCVGSHCNYPMYCPQFAEQQAAQQQQQVYEVATPDASAVAAPPPPPAAPAPRQGLFGRLGAGIGGAFPQLGRFAARFYTSPEAAQLAEEEGVQLGPRIYMSDEETVVCKTYEPGAGVSEYNPTQSSIRIPDEMDLVSMTVDMNVSHSRVGALKVELEAKSGKGKARKAILKPRGWGGSGTNMLSTTFDDESDTNFPKASGAPFSESYRPKGKLKRFVRGKGVKASKGGTAGLWTLRVTDVGRNPDTRTAVINNWRLNMCGKVDLNRERTPILSQDIIAQVEATEEPMPTNIACPGAILTEDGQCPLSAIDVVQSLIDGTYNTTYGSPGYQGDAGDEIASAQGYLPPIDGVPVGPVRQAYDDYVDRFNDWADTLPKLSEYLSTLPESTWELMIGYVYFNWLVGTLHCIRDGSCGTVVNNIPETVVIG